MRRGLGEGALLGFVFGVFFLSGFAALLYQVVWQRVLALFSGVDVYSITIIVAAFMGGLGLGSLAGGYLADRVAPRWRLVLFAAAEGSIALFALASKPLYYDLLYGQWVGLANQPAVMSAVLFLSLLPPTFAMGMSLPLLSKALTRRVEGAARIVGLLYAANTLGAAVGAMLTVWVFMRTLGFEATVLVGTALNGLVALATLAASPLFLKEVGRSSEQEAEAPPAPQPTTAQSAEEGEPRLPTGVWVAIYGLSGFVALSLEIVWFRLLGVMMKPTSFTFGNLLAIYLLGLAVGTFWGIRGTASSRRPGRTFLMLQAGIGLYAGLSVALLMWYLATVGRESSLFRYMGAYAALDVPQSFGALVGWLVGPGQGSEANWNMGARFVQVYFLLPLLVIGPPTVLMGLSFPYLQKVVQRDVATLGRRVGWLQTSNIFGSMLGAMLTGWVFLKWLGTAHTLRALMLAAGVFLALLVVAGRRRTAGRGGLALARVAASLALAGVAIGAGCFLLPGSWEMWATAHGTTVDRIVAAEDGTGLSVLKSGADGWSGQVTVFANGFGQSNIPFGGPHTTLGMLPVMLHPRPEEVAIIGLGSGDTCFSAGGRDETKRITCIEIVEPQLYTLKLYMEREPYAGIGSLVNDGRLEYVFTDGRSYLQQGDKKYDVIEADAVQPRSPYAGNLYSVEYFGLMRRFLKPGGLAVSWAPTPRTVNSFLEVFPHVVLYQGEVQALVGSNEPIVWDPAQIRERLSTGFTRRYYGQAGIDVGPYADGFEKNPRAQWGPADARPGEGELKNMNLDLFPKDEFQVP